MTSAAGGEVHKNYRESAEFFDLRYQQKNYAQEAERFRATLCAIHPDAKTLLDVACGTGRHLSHLEDSYEVEGLDLSPALIELARQRTATARYHIGDMCDFALPKTYDVVCCFFASIAMSGGKAKMSAALARMAQHLAPDGVLFIEPFLSPEVYREGEVVHNLRVTDDRKVSWMYVMKRRDDVALFTIHWLVGTKDEDVVHFVEHEEYGLATTADYLRMFADAGLQAFHHPRGLHGYGAFFARRAPWSQAETAAMTAALER